MYSNSPDLHSLQKVQIEYREPSSYVIRTQPLEECLSTVETAALTLAHVESDPSIYTTFVKPLNALCDFQLSHGAQKHSSKEFLVRNGLSDKPAPKNIIRKLRIKDSILTIQHSTDSGTGCRSETGSTGIEDSA